MKLFRFDSPLVRILETIFYLPLLGIVWCLLSLTLVGFGPASTALYYAVAKAVRRDRGTPFREFGRAIKENWLQSLIMGVILLAVYLSIYLFDLQYLLVCYRDGVIANKVMFVLALVKIFLAMGTTLYIFPVLSRFHVKIGKALLFCVSLTFVHLPATLWMMLLFAASVLIAIELPALGWIVPGFFVYFFTFPMEKVLRKYVSPEEAEATETNDAWYMEK